MKKKHSFNLILIFIILFSLFTFFIGIFDDDTVIDILCKKSDICPYLELSENPISAKGIYHRFDNVSICFESIISYLARHEKSPPLTISNIIFC